MPDETHGSTGEQSGDEVKMTQARFDAIIAERVLQAKRAAVTNLLGELDFDSLESLKQFITKSKADAKQFEADRNAWVAEKQSIENATKSTADELAALKQRTERSEIEAAIKAEAAKPEYKIAVTAINSVPKLVNMSLIVREGDTLKGIDAAVKAAIAENPFLISEAAPRGTPRTPQQPRQGEGEAPRRPVRKL